MTSVNYHLRCILLIFPAESHVALLRSLIKHWRNKALTQGSAMSYASSLGKEILANGIRGELHDHLPFLSRSLSYL